MEEKNADTMYETGKKMRVSIAQLSATAVRKVDLNATRKNCLPTEKHILSIFGMTLEHTDTYQIQFYMTIASYCCLVRIRLEMVSGTRQFGRYVGLRMLVSNARSTSHYRDAHWSFDGTQ
jgi:hypothetical protein